MRVIINYTLITGYTYYWTLAFTLIYIKRKTQWSRWLPPEGTPKEQTNKPYGSELLPTLSDR